VIGVGLVGKNFFITAIVVVVCVSLTHSRSKMSASAASRKVVQSVAHRVEIDW
jgi:hypothetical protein